MGAGNSFLQKRLKPDLALIAKGLYEVSFADLMIADTNQDDHGIFARIFYPTDVGWCLMFLIINFKLHHFFLLF